MTKSCDTSQVRQRTNCHLNLLMLFAKLMDSTSKFQVCVFVNTKMHLLSLLLTHVPQTNSLMGLDMTDVAEPF